MPDQAPAAGTDDWAADLLYGPEPQLITPTTPVTAVLADEPEEPSVGQEETTVPDAVDLDEHDGESTSPASPRTDGPDNEPAIRVGFLYAAGVVIAVVVLIGALVMFRGGDREPTPTEPQADGVATPAPQAEPVAPTPAPQPIDNQAIPFTAQADCYAGSTPAQSVTDTATDSAWVCVRGPAGGRGDGWVLYANFNATYLVSSLSMTPGWVPKTPGGRDEWLQHRVPRIVQYNFCKTALGSFGGTTQPVCNDADLTVFTQDTNNARGPVPATLPNPTLASWVAVIIRETARPPATPPPSGAATPAPEQGFLDSVLGGPAETTPSAATGEQGQDPVDATFAVSGLKFLGRKLA